MTRAINKATNERISHIKKAEGGGQKLDEMALRSILDNKDIAPKQQEAPGAAVGQPPIPASPDVPVVPEPLPPRMFPPLGMSPGGRSREKAPRRKRRTIR